MPQIIIIGGGAVGCGVAYQLALAGQTDVLVLEKETTLAAGTTSQAAGLVGQVRTSLERTRLAMWSVKTFRQLQQDGDAKPSWREVGSLRIATDNARVAEFAQMKDVADEAGLNAEFLDPARAERLWPVLDLSKVTAILWCPSDGYLQPNDLVMAYRAHARRLGVEFRTGCPVTGIDVVDGHVQAVLTPDGPIECQTVINAAGAHAYHVARQVGLELPIVPVRHEFLVTVRAPGMRPDLPVLRIPDATLYARAETDSLLVGGWEPQALSTDPRIIPAHKDAPRIEEDWDVLAAFATQLAPLYPPVKDLGIRSVFKGWPTFTPDGRFIIGESCRVGGFVMAGGCNAHGVSGSAGIGRHVVESMLEPEPSEYVKSLSPDRFTETEWDWESARRQAQHVYETYYALHH